MVRGLTAPTAESAAGTAALAVETEPITAALAEDAAKHSRIGLLGGTFDPPHIGHLVLATAAVEQLDLERVVFIPAGVPPHKQGDLITSGTDRLVLTRLAIAGEPAFELSPLEVERPGVSYTVDTLEQLTDLYGSTTSLFLIMAADSFAQLATWREPDRLLLLAEWAVGPRPGYDLPSREALAERWGARHERIHLLDAPLLAISSSDLRARVAGRRSIRYLVPRAVEDQVTARGLYRR